MSSGDYECVEVPATEREIINLTDRTCSVIRKLIFERDKLLAENKRLLEEAILLSRENRRLKAAKVSEGDELFEPCLMNKKDGMK